MSAKDVLQFMVIQPMVLPYYLYEGEGTHDYPAKDQNWENY